MIAIVTSCLQLVKMLLEVRQTMKDNWADCIRLCERSQVFYVILQKLFQNNGVVEKDTPFINLEKVLKDIYHFVKLYTERTYYRGMTRVAFRNSYAVQLSELHVRLDRSATEFHLSFDVDNEKKRQQDIEDSKVTFATLMAKISEEIAIQGEDMSEQFQMLQEDLKHFKESVNTYLESLRYPPLTKEEIDAVSSDIHLLSQKLTSKHDEIMKELTDIKLGQVKVGQDVQEIRFICQIMNDKILSNQQEQWRKHKLHSLEKNLRDVQILDTVLGHGGFGQVRIGKYRNSIAVAIKMIQNVDQPSSHLTKAQVKSVQNEILLMQYLHDPMIVSVYGYIQERVRMYVILELAPYGSLDTLLYNHDAHSSLFPLSLAVAWFCDITSAIDFIHLKKIQHRDIKAENLLMFSQLRLKLCDFGLAKQQYSSMMKSSTMNHSVAGPVGTTVFMAPEIRMGYPAEFASDIFSFAMTSIQILTRKLPRIDNIYGQLKTAVEGYVAVIHSTPPASPTKFSVPSPITSNSNQLANLLRLQHSLGNCLAYDQTIPANALRPCASFLYQEFHSVLQQEGEDPRGFGNAPIALFVEQIEKQLKNMHYQRQQPNNSGDRKTTSKDEKSMEEISKLSESLGTIDEGSDIADVCSTIPLKDLTEEQAAKFLVQLNCKPDMTNLSSDIIIDGELLDLIESITECAEIGINKSPLLMKQFLKRLQEYKQSGVPLTMLQSITEEKLPSSPTAKTVSLKPNDNTASLSSVPSTQALSVVPTEVTLNNEDINNNQLINIDEEKLHFRYCATFLELTAAMSPHRRMLPQIVIFSNIISPNFPFTDLQKCTYIIVHKLDKRGAWNPKLIPTSIRTSYPRRNQIELKKPYDIGSRPSTSNRTIRHRKEMKMKKALSRKSIHDSIPEFMTKLKSVHDMARSIEKEIEGLHDLYLSEQESRLQRRVTKNKITCTYIQDDETEIKMCLYSLLVICKRSTRLTNISGERVSSTSKRSWNDIQFPKPLEMPVKHFKSRSYDNLSPAEQKVEQETFLENVRQLREYYMECLTALYEIAIQEIKSLSKDDMAKLNTPSIEAILNISHAKEILIEYLCIVFSKKSDHLSKYISFHALLCFFDHAKISMLQPHKHLKSVSSQKDGNTENVPNFWGTNHCCEPKYHHEYSMLHEGNENGYFSQYLLDEEYLEQVNIQERILKEDAAYAKKSDQYFARVKIRLWQKSLEYYATNDADITKISLPHHFLYCVEKTEYRCCWADTSSSSTSTTSPALSYEEDEYRLLMNELPSGRKGDCVHLVNQMLGRCVYTIRYGPRDWEEFQETFPKMLYTIVLQLWRSIVKVEPITEEMRSSIKAKYATVIDAWKIWDRHYIVAAHTRSRKRKKIFDSARWEIKRDYFQLVCVQIIECCCKWQESKKLPILKADELLAGNSSMIYELLKCVQDIGNEILNSYISPQRQCILSVPAYPNMKQRIPRHSTAQCASLISQKIAFTFRESIAFRILMKETISRHTTHGYLLDSETYARQKSLEYYATNDADITKISLPHHFLYCVEKTEYRCCWADTSSSSTSTTSPALSYEEDEYRLLMNELPSGRKGDCVHLLNQMLGRCVYTIRYGPRDWEEFQETFPKMLYTIVLQLWRSKVKVEPITEEMRSSIKAKYETAEAKITYSLYGDEEEFIHAKKKELCMINKEMQQIYFKDALNLIIDYCLNWSSATNGIITFTKEGILRNNSEMIDTFLNRVLIISAELVELRHDDRPTLVFPPFPKLLNPVAIDMMLASSSRNSSKLNSSPQLWTVQIPRLFCYQKRIYKERFLRMIDENVIDRAREIRASLSIPTSFSTAVLSGDDHKEIETGHNPFAICGKCKKYLRKQTVSTWGRRWTCNWPYHNGHNSFHYSEYRFGCNTYLSCDWEICVHCWNRFSLFSNEESVLHHLTSIFPKPSIPKTLPIMFNYDVREAIIKQYTPKSFEDEELSWDMLLSLSVTYGSESKPISSYCQEQQTLLKQMKKQLKFYLHRLLLGRMYYRYDEETIQQPIQGVIARFFLFVRSQLRCQQERDLFVSTTSCPPCSINADMVVRRPRQDKRQFNFEEDNANQELLPMWLSPDPLSGWNYRRRPADSDLPFELDVEKESKSNAENDIHISPRRPSKVEEDPTLRAVQKLSIHNPYDLKFNQRLIVKEFLLYFHEIQFRTHYINLIMRDICAKNKDAKLQEFEEKYIFIPPLNYAKYWKKKANGFTPYATSDGEYTAYIAEEKVRHDLRKQEYLKVLMKLAA